MVISKYRNLLQPMFRRRDYLQAEIDDWASRDFLENSPQFVKERVFLKRGIQNAPWIETGTYLGTTTQFLIEHYPKVYTIEPEPELYKKAAARFRGRSVELFNDISENVLPLLLPKLEGDLNFWLDGHYSAGVTFRGPKDCPVEDELSSISQNLVNFRHVSVLIDDVRFMLDKVDDWNCRPSIDFLVDWAREHDFNWRVEHDIFLMKNF